MGMVLVVTPTRREARALGAGAFVPGAGATAGGSLAGRLRRERPGAVLIAGVCGGLDPSLHPGDLALARGVLDGEGSRLQPPSPLTAAILEGVRALDGVRVVPAPLLSLAQPVVRRDDKTRLWNEYGCAGIDMESHALAAAAEAEGLPWAVLRAVVDPADRGLPPFFAGWQGDADEARLARWLLRHPRYLPAITRLGLDFRRAMATLRRALPAVVHGLEAACTPTSL